MNLRDGNPVASLADVARYRGRPVATNFLDLPDKVGHSQFLTESEVADDSLLVE